MRVGEVVAIPGNVKDALRNSSSLRVTLAVVTKSELCAFFRELATRIYALGLASPEGNAAIDLRMV